jgi:membrane protein DedA with SNARE-associated domain
VKPLPLLAAAAIAVYGRARRRRLGRVELGVGAVVLAGCLAVGLGLVEPPDLEKVIEDTAVALGPYTYVLVGGLAYLETGAFVGLIAPGETAVLVGGVVAGQGQIDPILLFGLVWACAVGGDVTSYYLGRHLGRDFMLRHGPRFKITEERLVQVEHFFDRRGGSTILVGRFIGLVRALAPFIAGTARMPIAKFLPYDIVGAGLWAGLFVTLGYVFSRSLGTVTT